MVLLTDFLIGGYVCSDCTIHIEDNTTYPVAISPGSSEDRSFYEIALFWSNDLFATDFNQDLSTPDPGLWTPITVGGGVWYVQAFWVVNWNSLYTYAQNDICYYVNDFYYVNDAGGINPSEAAPSSNSKWTAMGSRSATLNYASFVTASGTGNKIGYSFASVDKYCNSLTLTRTDCLIHDLCNTTDSTLYFKVTDVAGTSLDTPMTDANATQYSNTDLVTGAVTTYWTLPTDTCTVLTLPSTGVYIIYYGDTFANMTSALVVFELCTYWDCYFSLIQQILCADFDPCCQNCDNESIRKNELFRLALNKMQGLMNTLQQKVSYDALKYLNVIAVPTDRSLLLTEIQTILDMLDDIIVRCGLCNGAQSTTITNPCTSC